MTPTAEKLAKRSNQRLRIAIVGAGRVGAALGCLLSRAGHRIVGVSCRSIQKARKAKAAAGAEIASCEPAEITKSADVVFITTPDDVIGPLAESLADLNAFQAGASVIHCSGALSSEILAPARRCLAGVGSLHPLQSFATVSQAVRNLPGSFCCIEGDPQTVPILKRLVRDLNGRELEIPPASKVLYHAAACVACNYFVALVQLALSIDKAAGIERETALASLLPLMRGTLDNIENAGIPQCLTGPISRGDAHTVRRHLEALSEALPQAAHLYCELGRLTADIAQEKGTLSKEKAEQLALIFSNFSDNMARGPDRPATVRKHGKHNARRRQK